MKAIRERKKPLTTYLISVLLGMLLLTVVFLSGCLNNKANTNEKSKSQNELVIGSASDAREILGTWRYDVDSYIDTFNETTIIIFLHDKTIIDPSVTNPTSPDVLAFVEYARSLPEVKKFHIFQKMKHSNALKKPVVPILQTSWTGIRFRHR